ncbi:MAG: PEP-CTERM sorting domain-containing protein [Azonexus sp.]|nr:PEP-CTERM sorting domain-containing protein [Azonexus sp.]
MRHLSLLLSALLFSAFAHAASNANITTASCSGSQSFDLTNGAMLSCDGDFSLIGGSIDSGIGITISAVGSLFLDDLKLSAPVVELKTLTGILSVAEGVSINVSNWTRFDIGTSPRLTVAQPGDLTLLERRTGKITVSPGGDISSGQSGQITLRNGGGIIVRQGGEIDLRTSGQIVLNGGGGLALVSSVPEPAMVWSLLGGGLLLAIRRHRRKDPA